MKIVVNESDRMMSWQWKQCTQEKNCSTTDSQGEDTARPVAVVISLSVNLHAYEKKKDPFPIPSHFWVLLKLIGIALRWFSSGMGGPPSRWPEFVHHTSALFLPISSIF